MKWYKRLRWRLIGTQLLVTAVGVICMVIATRLITVRFADGRIQTILVELLQERLTPGQTENLIVTLFTDAILLSVYIAALAAVGVGVVSSLVLWRDIIRPLRQMATSSQRIADGRYDERLAVPRNAGEALARLVTNFNQMAAALQEVEQKRIDMIGNVTHELRTPLTGLKGFVEGMSDGVFAADEKTFSMMEQELDRLTRLVDDIQTLSRVESGAIRLQYQSVSLTELVDRVTSQMQPQAGEKQIALTWHTTADERLTSTADRDRVAQILTNLVGNAIRHTPENGRVTITIHADKTTDDAVIEVTDTGNGIPSEALPYLFERFYRVDESRNRRSGGSGVGLTISRHLAWAMGGELTAHSDGIGRGSTFVLTLPSAGREV